jgi:hypothetical protein
MADHAILTPRGAAFLAAVEQLCRAHGIQLCTSAYDAFGLWLLEPGEPPIFGCGVEDHLSDMGEESMPDAPGFDERQERLYREAVDRTRLQGVLHALVALEPGFDVSMLSYRQALDCLRAACVAELERLDAAEQA